MTTFNVKIPDNKILFFKEFLNLLGADYVEKNEVFELTNQQKHILDERLKADKKDFIPARDALNKLRQKHEL